jgi:hypothetical protein
MKCNKFQAFRPFQRTDNLLKTDRDFAKRQSRFHNLFARRGSRMPASMPQPRAYTFKQAETLTTFARATWYRWEKRGLVRLIRVANKTLVPAEEIDRVMAGEAVEQARAGWRRGQPVKPSRLGRPRKVQIPPTSVEDQLLPEIQSQRIAAKAERAAGETASAAENANLAQPAERAMLAPLARSVVPNTSEAAITSRGLYDDELNQPEDKREGTIHARLR